MLTPWSWRPYSCRNNWDFSPFSLCHKNNKVKKLSVLMCSFKHLSGSVLSWALLVVSVSLVLDAYDPMFLHCRWPVLCCWMSDVPERFDHIDQPYKFYLCDLLNTRLSVIGIGNWSGLPSSSRTNIPSNSMQITDICLAFHCKYGK